MRFELEPDEVDTILEGLFELPMKRALPVVQKLHRQARERSRADNISTASDTSGKEAQGEYLSGNENLGR